ncbi:plasmid recombination protein [Staphylococcus epidermidis]|nr:plasmid recombination protein [Staphylococcus epidermidis]
MKLSWNAQKNKMSDVKGKEMEQENVVSAKVQMDEIAPHMHPYFTKQLMKYITN